MDRDLGFAGYDRGRIFDAAARRDGVGADFHVVMADDVPSSSVRDADFICDSAAGFALAVQCARLDFLRLGDDYSTHGVLQKEKCPRGGGLEVEGNSQSARTVHALGALL